jgi:hypothetical protein
VFLAVAVFAATFLTTFPDALAVIGCSVAIVLEAWDVVLSGIRARS